MKVLITSGGTKVAIDRVRHIGNMSSGTFGSKIATKFLEAGCEVTFVRAKGSKSPFSKTIDLCDGYTIGDFTNWVNKVKEYMPSYAEYEFVGFDDYASILESAIKIQKPDVILLAAAVADYGVKNYLHGKIRSANSMVIELEPLPKIITKVRQWAPNAKLVGFKLLVDSTHDELIAAAKKSIENNKCDMVVANDLVDIKNNDHQITLVYPNGDVSLHRVDLQNRNNLAQIVAEKSLELVNENIPSGK